MTAGAGAVAASCATGERPAPTDGGVIGFDARPFDGRVVCTADSECGDRIACTVDHCRAGACAHDPCTDCCAAGLACVPDFGCRTAPTPCTMDSECNDAIRCTLDRCRDATVCEHNPQPELCGMGEICLPAVGCIPEPPTMCTTAADCERGAACVGEWSCQAEFGCQFVSARDCNDADDCTVDSCVEERGGCVHDLRDVDGDTYADRACTGGDDCDDANPAIHPGAAELCNGADDNCDGMIDEGCCSAGPCTTTCDTMGTRGCNPDGSPGACVAPPEACNGADDDCDGMIDDGLGCALGSAAMACTTTCGSTGTRACLPGCTLDSCVPPTEACNGTDDDCDGSADDGFACVRGATTSCTTTCGSTGTDTCAADCTAGACTAPAETCNGTDDDCDGMTDEGFACAVGTSASCTTTCGSSGSRACLPGCTLDTCAPPAETCNGVDDNCNGACDDTFTCCRGGTAPCSTMGYFSGSAVCRTDCSGYDLSTCTNCGNGTRNPGEACDGADLGGAMCTSIGMGFGSGTLRCAAGCMFDTSMCSRCGNGFIDAGEQCDGSNFGGATCTSIGGGFTGGTLRCNASCMRDTSMCTVWNPTGTYTNSPRPMFACTWMGFPAVSFNIASFGFIDDGVTLRVTGARCGGAGAAMTGPTARNPSRSFDVTCTYTGTCDEIYRLVGMFTSDNVWTGTFYASYTGDCDTCDDPPQPRTWSVMGTRP